MTLRLLFDRCSASNQDMRENRRTNSNRAGYNFEKEIMPTLPDPNLEIKGCVCVGRYPGEGPAFKKNCSLRASVWYKKKEGGSTLTRDVVEQQSHNSVTC